MAAATGDAEAHELTELLDYLKRTRGFDFSGYKKTSLSRRIEKRMSAVGATSFADYQDYLEVTPREFTELFNTILINVTGFFRDSPAWEFLSEDVLPKLIEELDSDEPIRVWSAGCASGEEAYSLAIALAELLGEENFRARVKIYATDLDEDALADARQGVYSNGVLGKGVPEDLVAKYFEPNSRGLSFRSDLRRTIIFGRNDLVSDAPISRIHLLVCRNVLMYFTPEAQSHILERFNFALNRSGFLFLGKSEMLITHGDLFSPYNLKYRVFRKVQRSIMRERLAFVLPVADDGERDLAVRIAAASLSPVAQIVLDAPGFLVDANRRARETFAIAEADIGKPFQDVPLSYRPADLRTAVDRAHEQNATVRLANVRHADPAGYERVFEIEVAPLVGRNIEPLGTAITFTDVTAMSRLEEEFERSKRELENAHEELQSTVEELETTNEELQSTNEELETTNEELQSTNEALEAMNEELQSTNDELETMNNEVNVRAGDLDRVNLFLEGILGSLNVSVIVVDRAHKIQVWNATSNELWGLRADEVEGEDFMSLDIGLPVSELDDALARSFGGAKGPIEHSVDAVNRRGQRFECHVRVIPLENRAGEIYASLILAAPEGTLPPDAAR